MRTKFYKAKNLISSRVRGFSGTGKIFIILHLFLSGSLSGLSQTTSLSFTQIPTSSPDLIAPGRGIESWNGVVWNNGSGAGVMVPAGNTQGLNAYYRFDWGVELETSQGVYDWTIFDQQINNAIDAGQMFSFGLMPMCTACSNTGISGLTYPLYLHNLMQAEPASSQDWYYAAGNIWIPNWNSPNYLSRYQALLNAVAAHIASGSHNGKNYKDVIYYVDVRGYGDFGEWHTWPWYGTEPPGRTATSATLKALIDMNLAAFPNYPNVVMVGTFDQGNASLTPPDVTYYALTKTNAWGQMGWRRDNWGDPGLSDILNNNSGSYNPGSGTVSFSSLIMNKYQYAPVVGEPENSMSGTSTCGSQQCDLSNEVTLYHATSFGNGNFADPTDPALQANVIAASARTGYRLILTGGAMTTSLASNSLFNITLNWQNIGVAPNYEKWNVVYELRKTDGTVVWTGNSSFNPKLFLPLGSSTAVSDNLTLGSVAAGTYSMYLIIRDPSNYKAPLPLAITGRNADGSYLLRSNVTVGPGNGNQPPVVNAGANQVIQLPTSTVALTGTGTDASGTITNYSWSQVSGPAPSTITTPASASTTITGLVQGVYVFQLLATDNLNNAGSATVQVTVSSPSTAVLPVANAGTDATITLPVNSVSLNGSTSSDQGGTITAYLWTQISGPAQSTISNPNSAVTLVNNLTSGAYSFQLKVTDNLGDTSVANVKVTVNPAVPNIPPTANAGTDQIITLPANSVTLDGSGSKDPDGTIATYQWTQLSGPAQGTLASNSSVTTLLSNLVAGIYFFQLVVTDNQGAVGIDTTKVIVNPALPNMPPVANAGANFSITLPTSTANLNGSASVDPDGTIVNFAWSQVSGPVTATIATPAAVSSGISGLTQQGIYVFELTVTDNQGATNFDTMAITVNPRVNIPPVANAGNSRTVILPANSATLDGSLSYDPDGTIASYTWLQLSGPSSANITGSGTSSANATNLIAGIYTFQLTVTDNQGASSVANVKITVVPGGAQPPVANAGADQAITLPTNSVTLDASASTAFPGSIVAYAWTEKSGPSAVSLTNTVVNAVNNLQAGVYVFALIVTDNNGATGSDSVIITVHPAPNQPPVANAGPSVSLTLPADSAILDGTKSYDPDGTISSYNWRLLSGTTTPASAGANTATLSLTGLIAGQYIYQLTVTDNNGASSSAQVKVEVSPAILVPPVANAGPNQSITAPANTVVLDGSASFDPDGSITAYSWVTISGPGSITISNSNTATPTVTGLMTGAYIFELTVTDISGATAKNQVIVIVNPKPILPNQPPVANAGPNQTITLPVNSVMLNGASSFDPDGTITAWGWNQISGPSSAVISAGNTATPIVSQMVAGQYIFRLIVTDNNGAYGLDQDTITVNPETPKVNQLPIADAGKNDTIYLPTSSYVLDASGSKDPNGQIENYHWQQIGGPVTATSTSMNNAKVTLSNLQVGLYGFEVTVTNNAGATSSATMYLTVKQDTVTPSMLFLYPNPAHDVINAQITSSVDGTVKINVYDMNGRLVLMTEAEKANNVIIKTFDIGLLAPGMYTVQMVLANRQTMVAKFVKY